MSLQAPVLVRMHPADNVAIVGNEGGLPAGTVLAEPAAGLVLRERVPQAHKVALVDIPADTAVTRYGVTIGHALRDLPAGSWVHERVLRMPPARGLDDLPMGLDATTRPPQAEPLEGYT
ncbi:MAG: UxaA family hydrolase, partial [Rubrivivax sp.]